MRESKSSINIKKVRSIYYAMLHNLRKNRPSYLLPKEFITHNNVNYDIFKGEKDIIKEARRMFSESLDIYMKDKDPKKGGNRPKFENVIHEAIINIKQDTSIENLAKVSQAIYEITGYKALSMHIHTDEGYLIEKGTENSDNPICLTAGKDYWVDDLGVAYKIQKGKKKYTKDEPLDTSRYLAKHNYHAHIILHSFTQGVQCYGKVTKKQLSELQDRVADILGMERGQKNTGKKHINHSEYKEIKHQQNQLNNKERELKSRESKVFVSEQLVDEKLKEIKEKEKTTITQDDYDHALDILDRTAKIATKAHKRIVKEIGNVIRLSMKGKGYTRADFKELEEIQNGMYSKLDALVPPQHYINLNTFNGDIKAFCERKGINVNKELDEIEKELIINENDDYSISL